MSLYTDAAADALALLTEFGQVMTLTVKGAMAYNPATATVTASTTNYTGRGVLLDYDDKGNAGARFDPNLVSSGIQGTGLIQRGDKYVLLATAGMPASISPGASIATAAGELWSVVNVKTLAPAGTPVLHELQVRRG